MESTWETRELPVLEAIVRLYDETGTLMSPHMIGATAGLSEDEVQKALRALRHNDPPFVTKMPTQSIWSALQPAMPDKWLARGRRRTASRTGSLPLCRKRPTTNRMRQRRASSGRQLTQ